MTLLDRAIAAVAEREAEATFRRDLLDALTVAKNRTAQRFGLPVEWYVPPVMTNAIAGQSPYWAERGVR